MTVLSNIDQAIAENSLHFINRKTEYFEYKLLVRSKEEIKFNVTQNISIKSKGGEYMNPLFSEAYQNGNPEFNLELLNQEDVWLDVGAHIGLFATRMLTQFPRIQRVLAYEPFPANVEFAKQNLILNKVADRCEIVEKALVPDDTPELDLYLSSDSGKHSNLKVKYRDSIKVKAENINNVIGKCTAMKMDIEGYEVQLIKAIKDWSNIRIFFLEYHFNAIRGNRLEIWNEIFSILQHNFDYIYYNKNAVLQHNFITHLVCVKKA